MGLPVKGKKILIIDDNALMRDLVARVFQKEGAWVMTAEDGREGLHYLHETNPDLVILDILMPGADGFETLRQIRQNSNVGVIMLSVQNGDKDVLRGLQDGADDHIGKPFNPSILLARAQAVMRRTDLTQNNGAYIDGYLEIDLEERLVKVRGQKVKLTVKEFKLLAYLFRRSGRVCTFDEILSQVWGGVDQSSVDNIHVFIYQLRRKIEPDPKKPIYILNEHGLGYRFTRENQP